MLQSNWGLPKSPTSSKFFTFLMQTFRNLKPLMICLYSPSWLINTFGVFLYLTFIFPKSLSGIHIYHQPRSLVQSSSEQSPDLYPGHILYVSACGKRRLTFTSFWGDELLLLLLWYFFNISNAVYGGQGGGNICFCSRLELTFCYDSRCWKQVTE